MPSYEYKVVPAPEKARKVRGLKGPALFAHALEEVMNELGADGWQYVRADTLPQEERSGLTNKTTTYRNLLVFQREIEDDEADVAADPTPQDTPAPPALPDDDEEVTNLWQALDIEDENAPSRPEGERKRVDL
ncbi:DUF4177 domain-containing protein [Hasllibacter sp. MH4015]|uniref:DUF4177 domain-containing protein n=1 Tax=Hasllibacter sp. MH4015 TaxID=2854029 RepID=UPI001CD42FC3|nr:DUF4177 domain-containing protein [Hasllibacter sp. MH4015]